MRGHNICFHRKKEKTILELSSIPCLIWSSDFHVFSVPEFIAGIFFVSVFLYVFLLITDYRLTFVMNLSVGNHTKTRLEAL